MAILQVTLMLLGRPFNHVSRGKTFVGKALESIIKIDKLYFVIEKNVAAKTNNFFKHLCCCRVAETVGSNIFIYPKHSNSYIGYEKIAEEGFQTNVKLYSK